LGPLLRRLLNKKKRKQPQTLRFFPAAQSSASHLLRKTNGKRQAGSNPLLAAYPRTSAGCSRCLLRLDARPLASSALPRCSSLRRHPLCLDVHPFGVIRFLGLIHSASVLVHFLDDDDGPCWASALAFGAEQAGRQGGVRRGAGRRGGRRGRARPCPLLHYAPPSLL
jgi:hypothetical protein